MNRSLSFLICGAAIYGGTIFTRAAAAAAKDGEPVYSAKCKNCHGADGAGNPAIAKMMKVTMKPLGGETDAEVKTAVTAGVGKMKPVAGISAGDLENLTAYVHTLNK
jgi:mono/diheme cytochrome c family protein